MLQARVLISGLVQAVGYRYFVKSWAKQFGITGFVRNLPDGSVEVLLQADKGVIEKLIEKCRKGPFLAEVKDVEVSWEDVEVAYGDFRVS